MTSCGRVESEVMLIWRLGEVVFCVCLVLFGTVTDLGSERASSSSLAYKSTKDYRKIMEDEIKNQNVTFSESAGTRGDSLAVGGRNSIEIGNMVSFSASDAEGSREVADS